MKEKLIKINYFKNSLWILLEKVSRIISGIFVGVLVARYLGPTQFGTISYALSIIAIFTIVSTLGLDGLVVREIITRKENLNEILGTSFWLRFVGAILVVFLATTYSYIRDTPDRVLIVFLISISIVFQSITVIDFYFQSQVKGKYAAMNQVITLICSAIVKLVLIYLQASLLWFASVVLFESALTAILQVYFFRKLGHKISYWYFSFDETKKLLVYAWPIIISAFIQMLYQKSNEILILRFLHEMDLVGQYAAAIRISEASYFIPVAIVAAVMPGIININGNKELQKQRFIQLSSLLVWLSILIIIGGLLFGDWVINLLYKNKYYLSPQVFKIHIFSIIPSFFGTALGGWLVAQNRQKIIVLLQVVNLIIYIPCCYYLIPRYQINGAAMAINLTYYFSLFVVCLFYNKAELLKLFFYSLHPKHLKSIILYIKSGQ
ncbi:MAG: flippase [Bacteroidetes bacterium]|nr:flippase [Bacteroidota bacterium]